jgi:very-long-chain enoyl-CoA reductase
MINSIMFFDINKSYEYDEMKFIQLPKNILDNPSRYKWKEASPNQWKLKDYGPQISWRTVYIIEYFGALIALPIMMNFQLLRIDVILWILHYVKRLYESIFIHSFSSETMPLTNVFKNSIYYWGAGLVIGYIGNKVESDTIINNIQPFNIVIMGLWIICQFGNGYCHYYLANLRAEKMITPNGVLTETNITQNKHINPTNFLFRLVCCPNYGFEIIGWFLFSLLSNPMMINNTFSTNEWIYFSVKIVFCMIGAVQMFEWAKGKRKRYKRLFDDKYKVNKLLIPFMV